MSWGTQEEQRTYYHKVWNLHRRVNHQILLMYFDNPTILRPVEPNFPALQVTIVVREAEGDEFSVLLNPLDEEGIVYTLKIECQGGGAIGMIASWGSGGAST